MRERLRPPCFFCTSRLQTKSTLSNSNIAYSWMSWCAKFHCIISKTRYLIYGNHIRPKRSRLRRCDSAAHFWHTATLTLRKLRTNEGKMAPRRNYSTSYGKSQSCTSWSHRHMKARQLRTHRKSSKADSANAGQLLQLRVRIGSFYLHTHTNKSTYNMYVYLYIYIYTFKIHIYFIHPLNIPFTTATKCCTENICSTSGSIAILTY